MGPNFMRDSSEQMGPTYPTSTQFGFHIGSLPYYLSIKERSKIVYIVVAANFPQLREFVFTSLGPYRKTVCILLES